MVTTPVRQASRRDDICARQQVHVWAWWTRCFFIRRLQEHVQQQRLSDVVGPSIHNPYRVRRASIPSRTHPKSICFQSQPRQHPRSDHAPHLPPASTKRSSHKPRPRRPPRQELTLLLTNGKQPQPQRLGRFNKSIRHSLLHPPPSGLLRPNVLRTRSRQRNHPLRRWRLPSTRRTRIPALARRQQSHPNTTGQSSDPSPQLTFAAPRQPQRRKHDRECRSSDIRHHASDADAGSSAQTAEWRSAFWSTRRRWWTAGSET